MGNLWDYRECVWKYRESTWTLDSDLIGYVVEGIDGRLGVIVRASGAADGAFLVVDTCRPFEGRRLLPAVAVASIRHVACSVHMALSTQQVKDAPECEGDVWNDAVRKEHEHYYGRTAW